MVKRQVVGAHYGLKDWIAQRGTAVFMAIYTVIFAFSALMLPELSYEAWSGMFSGGLFKFLSFLFFLSVFYHAWIGVRDIWMDYVKPTGARLALHLVTLFLLVGYAGWAAQILWRL
ncbi:MAG: succinate dehydrogenase, hydrophobic membrane anchor protein [Azoarcus sp.]|jgi:succinate dehydrogenase / fumarate reductase membrane anchor subunit|nr:MAG: succinate dehydrogenase, hydrophobic membrane anchor protein [Azoarcus sp.]TVT61047.1 MAG: succinate dehydrogenase, hydrophobic membrane anchor protein [Azoarcus sp. PHD]